MKKGVLIASAIAAAIGLAGCSQPQPIPQDQTVYQSGPSGKLGKSCKHRCKSKKCKRHCASANY